MDVERLFELVEENHEEILKRTTAFARVLIDCYNWFRGDQALPFGKEAEDFSMEALTRLLEQPEKFDIEKSELTVDSIVTYMNLNVMRNLVRGDSKKDENVFTDDIDDNFEESLPFAEITLEQQVDLKEVKKHMENVLSEEDDLYEIFTGLFEMDLKRREICQQLNISPEEYDRRMARLSNRLEKAAKYFGNKD